MHGCSESRFVIVSCEVMKKQAVHVNYYLQICNKQESVVLCIA